MLSVWPRHLCCHLGRKINKFLDWGCGGQKVPLTSCEERSLSEDPRWHPVVLRQIVVNLSLNGVLSNSLSFTRIFNLINRWLEAYKWVFPVHYSIFKSMSWDFLNCSINVKKRKKKELVKINLKWSKLVRFIIKTVWFKYSQQILPQV